MQMHNPNKTIGLGTQIAIYLNSMHYHCIYIIKSMQLKCMVFI